MSAKMSDPIGFVDDARTILRMSGSDTRAVLQGVVTNDVEAVDAERPVYAALLTPQGKYLFDFFLISEGEDILIDTALDQAEELTRRLTMYALRREARIVPDPNLRIMVVWARAGGPSPAPSSRSGDVIMLPDPRDPHLGWRLYGANLPDEAANILGDIGAADRATYDALRVTRAIPETGRELLPEDTYILEAGFERLNGVDFHKGCYVGQEVTARMKHKTELRKGLAMVAVEGNAPEGAELMTEDGKPAGRLFTQSGGRGLAHLRFDRAQGPLQADAAIVRYDPPPSESGLDSASDANSASNPSR